VTEIQRVGLSDGAVVSVVRGRKAEQLIRLGVNEVHTCIVHADGSITDLGVNHNLLTNAGRDLIAAAMGATGFGVSGTIATASSATSLTATGTPFTSDQYKGWTVYAEESTNAPVFGNIGSNTTSVLTVDAWRTGDDTAGTTPGSTANYSIIPTVRARYMALSTNASASAATDTSLTSEVTTNGGGRVKATYAHTGGTATFTMSNTFSISGTITAIHKMGLLTCSTTAAAGVLVFATDLNADATVVNGDSLAVTWTGTISG
jgi:hypothetical protein